MTAGDLLTTLYARGLVVSADGNALVVRPRDLLTDELRAAIPAHKRELLAELPRFRWLITWPDGRRKEICALPEITAANLAPCYPGAQFMPLPDCAAQSGAAIHKWSPAYERR